jgi:sec-independent protein translocase protein TatA
MFGLSTTELLIVLVVLLLLFGSRLPNVMRSLGKSVTEFKKGMNEMDAEPSADVKKDNKNGKPSDTTPAG